MVYAKNVTMINSIEENLELSIQFEKRGGLIPCIVQDDSSLEILMLGYINEEALKISIATRKATFYSTSRKEIWTKGNTSGDTLMIKGIYVDCDQDSVIYRVERMGSGACHTKNSKGKTRKSCFYRKIAENSTELVWLTEMA